MKQSIDLAKILKEKEKELGELEKKLSVKQRMDMVLKANDAFISLTQKDLTSRKWSWNTSVKMVSVRLHEEREKSKHEPINKIFRTRSLAKPMKFHQCKILSQATGSMSTREPENYSVDKFIKLPKKEKFGVLEDLANNFFNSTTNASNSNSSRVTSKDLCLAVPIDSKQYSIRYGDDTLANIFSARLSHIVRKPSSMDIVG